MNKVSRISCDLFIVVYSSPFTGKTYNFDFLGRWNHAPPAMTSSWPAHPFSHVFNKEVRWNFNHGSKVENNGDIKSKVEVTTAGSPNSYSGHFAHKFIDVNWSVDYNLDH